MKNIPLSILIENTKGKLFEALNTTLKESGLPAFLIEGMILEILSEVRNMKNLELLSDFNKMKELEKEKSEEEGKQ